MKLRTFLPVAILALSLTACSQPSTTAQPNSAPVAAAPDQNVSPDVAFLKQNKSKPGVFTLADGLQYKVIKEGSGAIPTASSTVTVNYKGKLVDGTVFDSSYKRGQPAIFRVGDVIPGWTEILQKMPVGSTYKVYIPSDLGYGAAGGGPIPPNSTLIFKVELLEINSAQ